MAACAGSGPRGIEHDPDSVGQTRRRAGQFGTRALRGNESVSKRNCHSGRAEETVAERSEEVEASRPRFRAFFRPADIISENAAACK